jgi:hypothetical protein
MMSYLDTEYGFNRDECTRVQYIAAEKDVETSFVEVLTEIANA